MRNFVLTSTSVTDGHPDKLCDRISDAVVDRALTRAPDARIMSECAIANGLVFISTYGDRALGIDLPELVREVVGSVGYDDPTFNPANLSVITSTNRLPASVAERRSDVNATVFGFACRQTPEFLPLPIALAHRLARRLSDARREGALPFLYPDGQVQVAIRYRERRAERVDGVALATALTWQAPERLEVERLLEATVLRPELEADGLPEAVGATISINPPGAFLVGGPTRHAGLTGRKADIDTYGGYVRQSGAALSGKDPGRVDRSGAYMARHVAKTVVAAGIAEECEVQLSYRIGLDWPVSLAVDTFGTGRSGDDALADRLLEMFDFTPRGIDAAFGLSALPRQRGGRFFSDLTAFGHMGRLDLDLPWERTDRAGELEDLA
ncbi:methionine adenosyltransferase [Minwuia thermotolerans]|uniref:Methionine adenosyltransferase n=1 Tax=Minwuia thermotolerans TaxID=2056226 RepID=A0A2M9G391_9PROT|nr:methionine adenosyltransferase [Minwuia thermotolerans]PJK30197.1 methionine adenosyltransferase [Minwuia thermotolerans]